MYLIKPGYMMIRTSLTIDGIKVTINDYIKGKVPKVSRGKRMIENYGI